MDPLRTTSYIASVVYTWDWVSQFSAEYDLLWRHPRCNPSPAQTLYFVTRYSTFLCHAGHLAMINITNKHLPTVPEHLCRNWLFFSIVAVGLNYELLLMNLMLKVYALHQRNPQIIFLMVFLTCVKIGNLIVTWFFFLPTFTYAPNCMPLVKKPSAAMALSTAIDMLVLATPVYLTLSRGTEIRNMSTQRTIIEFVRKLKRESVACWSLLSTCSVTIISVFLHSGKSASPVLHLTYPLIITFVSIMCCHLILRMRQGEQLNSSEDCNRTLSSPGNPSLELDSYELAQGTRTPERGLNTAEPMTASSAVT